MRDAFLEAISYAANKAGLPDDKIIDIVKKDNLTIARPRIELQFLPEKLTRTGRKLAIDINEGIQSRKRELYQVEQDVAANVLAEDENWLEDFCYAFLAELPRGIDDKRGNFVKITGHKATFARPRDTRVGESVIKVFNKVNELILVTFLWRITAIEVEELIRSHNLQLHYK
ncbi:MAG: translation initiation factor 2 [Desulfovibrio sp.]|nr:translation initiation factor 2 [Desulfovibrio sp.]